jgi:arylsulfatase A-like enzyme
MSRFSRRDFLKLAALLPAGAALTSTLARYFPELQGAAQTNAPNVIIFLFDAMSARNLSLYGYPRNTTPNFIRFASHANVYHSHYSAGNFTIPGTTSLLTGLYPWTHRAITEAGMLRRDLTGDNIFRAMAGNYQRLAFGQNIWANFILNQFQSDIEIRLAPQSYGAASAILGDRFKDMSGSYRALDNFLFKFDKFGADNNSASLLFATVQRILFLRQLAQAQNANSQQYPLGLPLTEDYPIYYKLPDVFNGVTSDVLHLQQPTFAYFHLYPPHEPYRPSRDFYTMFLDHYKPLAKPLHTLSSQITQNQLNNARRVYDEYIADLDWNFGNLLDALEKSGVFEKSIVVVTADHGQLLERGEEGHVTPMLYDPVVHIPLIVSMPGQTTRTDILDPTNSVDVLPTLAHLSGHAVPAWGEGALLPGLGGTYDTQRATFTVEAKLNPAFAPLKIATIAMRKGPYKLIHYLGYAKPYDDAYELYNLVDDLEEMNDLYSTQTEVAAALKAELLARLAESNSHFKA